MKSIRSAMAQGLTTRAADPITARSRRCSSAPIPGEYLPPSGAEPGRG